MKLFQVDAFTSTLFKGNPAAVVPLDEWPDADRMRAIAAENNLSETAFFARAPGGDADFHLRWFTPTVEVELCGHATLAAAHVLWEHLGWSADRIRFTTEHAGLLGVMRESGRITLDFPSRPLEPAEVTTEIVEALGRRPAEVYKGMDLVCVFENKRDVHELAPDFRALERLTDVRVGVTAPGAGHDFVSRRFAPQSGINEDPVTGSLYTMLAPYWAKRLGKDELTAHQVSRRGGEVWCRNRGDRVHIGGHAVTYLEGEFRAA